MFEIDTDKTISITRGDSGSFVAPIDYALQPGDVLRLKVFRKKACEDVVLQKDFAIGEATETVTLELTEKDTRIGGIISKPVDYWYEIELNPDNNPKTLVGYDEDGAKIFKLYPEGRDLEDDELTEEEVDTFRKYLDEFRNEINVYLEKEVAEMKGELEKFESELQGDLDEIGDLVGGKDSGTGELVADIGDIELSNNDGAYTGTFTLPENSIEPGKLYIINIDGTEYKSGSLGAQGEFYISNDARENSMIMMSKQEDVWTVAIYSANDFSGVHNIKIYKNSGEKKPYQILVGSRTDTGTGGSGMVYFYTDDFDAGSYNLEIKDEESTFNLDSHRYLDNIAFGFKSCDKAYSDASLKQVYLAIADGKKVSLIVTGRKDGIETTKTYILGTPDFEFTNQYTPRHYYCYGENYIPFMDCPS